MKRDTYANQTTRPHYPGEDGTVAMARHLSVVARRFVGGRANRREVDEAIEWWRKECEKRWPSRSPGGSGRDGGREGR